MRFWLSLVTNTEPEQLPAIARHAEEVGFHGVTVPDHLVMSTRIAADDFGVMSEITTAMTVPATKHQPTRFMNG